MFKITKECMICKEDGKDFVGSRGRNSIGSHIQKVHGMKLEDYLTKFTTTSDAIIQPLGKCFICSAQTTWSKRYKQYNKTCGSSCTSKLIHKVAVRKEKQPKQAPEKTAPVSEASSEPLVSVG